MREYFAQILKIKEKDRKGKEKKSYIFIVYITVNITGGELIFFFEIDKMKRKL